ncbi:MAG: alpha/beta hydrolase [Actinomycetaceae bacterium]|nr:alpha/beta hydrolase [Arcanobacterium sp.]MDD7505692.1 alpha/beta hydrolase [Actinomycetaceae bacterium]MDY6142692.1 alpha/beta hydrolase [Arcanobacterium sp.]
MPDVSFTQSHVMIPNPHPTSLAYYEWRPKEHPGGVHGVVQLAHGMVEHLGRYADFAQYLAEQGYVVVGADHRGHGKSASADAPLGYFGDDIAWEVVAHDLDVVRRYAQSRFPGLPYVMFGHSMGSFLLRIYLSRKATGLAGAAIIGSGQWPGLLGVLGLGLARTLSTCNPTGTGTVLDKLAFGPYNKPFEGRTSFDWLSRDLGNVDRYIADPLSGFVPSNAFYAELFHGLRMANQPEAFLINPEIPLYIASGEVDPVGGASAVDAIASQYREAGMTDIETHVYPNDRHEIFNETDKDAVWADFATWLKRVCDA